MPRELEPLTGERAAELAAIIEGFPSHADCPAVDCTAAEIARYLRAFADTVELLRAECGGWTSTVVALLEHPTDEVRAKARDMLDDIGNVGPAFLAEMISRRKLNERFATLLDALADPERSHPETVCERCHRANVWSWHAPSPLWNAVMRDPVTGTDVYSIVCPVCFAELVEAKGLGLRIDGAHRLVWCFAPHRLDVVALWADPDGRVWDVAQCLWVDPQ